MKKGFLFSALFMYGKKKEKENNSRTYVLAHWTDFFYFFAPFKAYMRWRTALIVREVEEEVIFTDFCLFFFFFLGLYALAHCTDCAGGGGGSHCHGSRPPGCGFRFLGLGFWV